MLHALVSYFRFVYICEHLGLNMSSTNSWDMGDMDDWRVSDHISALL